MKKYLFIVFYTVIQWVEVPCPISNIGCIVYQGRCMAYHGTKLDTTIRELITIDSSKVNTILGNHKKAKVDTFLLTPIK